MDYRPTLRPRKPFTPFLQGPRYKPGDIVYLKTGHAPQRVLEVKEAAKAFSSGGYMIRCEYTRWFAEADRCKGRWRTEDDYLRYQGNPDNHDYDNKKPRLFPALEAIQKDEQAMGQKLYQTLEETPRFGTFLTRNSTGKLVLEMKGTGDVIAFDASDLEEVKPYTISLSLSNNSHVTLEAAKGKVKEGDVLLVSNPGSDNRLFAAVTGINTGYEGKTSHLDDWNAKRIVTEDL